MYPEHFLRVKGEGQPPQPSSNHVCPWIWSERVSEDTAKTKAGFWQCILHVILVKLKHREKGCRKFWVSGDLNHTLAGTFLAGKYMTGHDSSRVPEPSCPVLLHQCVDSLHAFVSSPYTLALVSSARVGIFSFHWTWSSYVSQVGLELLMLCHNLWHTEIAGMCHHIYYVPLSHLKGNFQKPPILKHFKPLNFKHLKPLISSFQNAWDN